MVHSDPRKHILNRNKTDDIWGVKISTLASNLTIVSQVFDNSPAAAADIKENEIITAIGDVQCEGRTHQEICALISKADKKLIIYTKSPQVKKDSHAISAISKKKKNQTHSNNVETFTSKVQKSEKEMTCIVEKASTALADGDHVVENVSYVEDSIDAPNNVESLSFDQDACESENEAKSQINKKQFEVTYFGGKNTPSFHGSISTEEHLNHVEEKGDEKLLCKDSRTMQQECSSTATLNEEQNIPLSTSTISLKPKFNVMLRNKFKKGEKKPKKSALIEKSNESPADIISFGKIVEDSEQHDSEVEFGNKVSKDGNSALIVPKSVERESEAVLRISSDEIACSSAAKILAQERSKHRKTMLQQPLTTVAERVSAFESL